jgi:hypothetical protein
VTSQLKALPLVLVHRTRRTCVAGREPCSVRGCEVIRRCSSALFTAWSTRGTGVAAGRDAAPQPARSSATIGSIERSLIPTMLAAAALALFIAPAASGSWGVSRVAAVQAVVRAVRTANPIMQDPKYAPAESEYGVQVVCRRRAVGRYRCSWLAVNTYSVLAGRARVHFVHARARVKIRQTSCRRHVGPNEDSALVRCAEVGYEAGHGYRR